MTVTDAVLETLELTPLSGSAPAGTKQRFLATGIYSDGSNLDLTASATWTSSDTAVATVSDAAGSKGLASAATVSNALGSKGLATTVAAGTTTISASRRNTANDLIVGSTSLTVSGATLQSITVTPANPDVVVGSKQQMVATGNYSDASTADLTTQVTWASSAGGVANVSNAPGSKGLVTALATGTATISATLDTTVGPTVVTVINPTLQSVTVAPVAATINIGTTQRYTATANYEGGATRDLTADATWASNAPAIATVENGFLHPGRATGVAEGEAGITATFNGVISDAATLTVSDLVLDSSR